MERTIQSEFWHDPKIKALNPVQKLFFVYLFTNKHSHISGIYYLPDEFIVKELGIQQRFMGAMWPSVETLQLARRDPDGEIVFIKNMLKIQTHGAKVSNLIKESIVKHLPTLHRSYLIDEFLAHYKELNIPYTIPYPIGYGIPHVVSSKYQVAGSESSVLNNKKAAILAEFSEFWKAYPNRKSRDRAERAWAKLAPSPELLATMLGALGAQIADREKRFNLNQWVPEWKHPATWLNDRCWEDEVSNGSTTGNSAGQRTAPAATGIAGAGSADWEAEKRRSAARRDRLAEVGGNAGEAAGIHAAGKESS